MCKLRVGEFIRSVLIYTCSILLRFADGTWLERSRSVRRFHSYVVSCIGPVASRLNGHIFYLDPFDSIRGGYPPADPALNSYLKKILKSGDRVADVGAHIGYFTVVMAKLVAPEGHVYAFEPTTSSIELLNRNIEANNVSNVTVISNAVSDSPGVVKMCRSKCPALNYIDSDGNASSRFHVATVCLDEILLGESIRFLKLDVEGSEVKVLNGMKQLLLSCPELEIYAEVDARWLSRANTSVNEMAAFLDDFGFKFFKLNQDGTPCSLTLENLIAEASGNGVDVLCKR